MTQMFELNFENVCYRDNGYSLSNDQLKYVNIFIQ